MKPHRSLPSLGLIAAIAVTLAACGTGGTTTPNDSPTPSPSTVTSTASPAATSQETSTEPTSDTVRSATSRPDASEPDSAPMGTPDSTTKLQYPEGNYELLVTGIRIGEHEGFDRLVFDLDGTGTPGWFTELTDTPTQQASGHPLDYEGGTALYLTIMGTPYPTGTDRDGQILDHGPHPGGGVITGVNFSSVFEAHSEFIIGLDESRPFSVTYLEDPKRVVVDIVTQ